MALGADWCNSARGFMFALGCIQSQSCHTDRCPTGVSNQDRARQRALVVPDKAERYSISSCHGGSGRRTRGRRGPQSSDRICRRAFSRRVSAHEVRGLPKFIRRWCRASSCGRVTDRRLAAAWKMADAAEFARGGDTGALIDLDQDRRRPMVLDSSSGNSFGCDL